MPFAAPAWMLAWWTHVRPERSQLRVVVVRDRECVIGVVPLYVVRSAFGVTDARMLGTGHRVGPLAVPGREQDVGRAAAAALAHAPGPPTLIRLDRADASSRWGHILQGGWPGRAPTRLQERIEPAPVLVLPEGGFERWLAGKSGNFRQQMRAGRRRLERAGATVRLTTSSEELAGDIDAFVRLHDMRWAHRRSNLATARVGEMLRDAAAELLSLGRLRIWSIALDGVPIASAVNVVAGGETAFWNIGWDPGYAHLKPGLMVILAAVEDAFERGGRRFDFGGGANSYKSRFTDVDAPLSWTVLVPRGRRYPIARGLILQEAAGRGARRLVKGLPAGIRDPLASAARRGSHRAAPREQGMPDATR